MVVANTWLPKPPARSSTYGKLGASWDFVGRTWVMDSRLAPHLCRHAVNDVESHSGSGLPSDHVQVIMQLSGCFSRRPTFSKQGRRVEAEGHADQVQGSNSVFRSGRATHEGYSGIVEAMWAGMQQLPEKPRAARRPWIRAATWDIVDLRQAESHRLTAGERAELSKAIKRPARAVGHWTAPE